MTLKKFLKYFDSMCELCIVEFCNTEAEFGLSIFEGHTFDKGAKKKLKELYKENYVLNRNEDGDAVIVFVKTLDNGVHLPLVQINVRKEEKPE